MPISSFYGLQTTLRGLLAQQRSLDTTGHNIANASTVGYSRQEAALAAAPALIVPAGARQSGDGAHIGAGVDVLSYRRVRDTFLDLQFRGQATRLGEEKGRAEGLERAELSLAEPGENGINQLLSRFWDAWADLANAPDDPAAQQALLEQGRALTEGFRTVDGQLALVQSQAQAEYADHMRVSPPGVPGGQIQELAREIGNLNGTIKAFVTSGDVPNDLLDRRDVLLDKLAGFGQISVTDLGTGSIDVTLGGRPLVSNTTASWAGAAWTQGNQVGGRLGALLDVGRAGGLIDSFRADLDAVANQLAAQVNGPLTAGGAPAFFSGAGAAGIQVDPAAVAGVRSLAGGPGRPAGENGLALAMTALRGGQPDKLYRAFVARVGSEVRDAGRQEANAQVLADAVDDRRQSVAGVALDEEMANLVRFQRGYQASARAMSTMDEMLDVLINRTGRVGL